MTTSEGMKTSAQPAAVWGLSIDAFSKIATSLIGASTSGTTQEALRPALKMTAATVEGDHAACYVPKGASGQWERICFVGDDGSTPQALARISDRESSPASSPAVFTAVPTQMTQPLGGDDHNTETDDWATSTQASITELRDDGELLGVLIVRWDELSARSLGAGTASVEVGPLAALSPLWCAALSRRQRELRAHQSHNQLQHSQRLFSLARTLGGVAHDINNYLGVVTGFGEFVVAELPADSPARQDMDEIFTATRRVQDLTGLMQGFSRLHPTTPEVIDLNITLLEHRKLWSRTVEHAALSWDLADRLPKVRADPHAVALIILNLLSNAGEATRADGKITVMTRAVALTADEIPPGTGHGLDPGEWVTLAIQDDGEGIPPELHDDVFEPYVSTRVQDWDREARPTRPGFGLTQVHGAACAIGGTITLQSRVNQGSTFTLWLPAVAG